MACRLQMYTLSISLRASSVPDRKTHLHREPRNYEWSKENHLILRELQFVPADSTSEKGSMIAQQYHETHARK